MANVKLNDSVVEFHLKHELEFMLYRHWLIACDSVFPRLSSDTSH